MQVFEAVCQLKCRLERTELDLVDWRSLALRPHWLAHRQHHRLGQVRQYPGVNH
jgi:hypothetical protein